MLIIIAKIKADNRVRASYKKDEGYRVFDTDTLQVSNYSRKRILDAMKNNVKVKGLIYNTNSQNINIERGRFNYYRIPVINGYGKLVSNSNNDTESIYGYKGFAEAKQFYTVNYNGDIHTLTIDELIKAVKQNKINGAKIIDNKVAICKDLNNEIVA